MNNETEKAWRVLSRFVEITSPWLTVIGERLLDNDGKELEYWRVEKADSLIIIVVQENKLLLPKPMYRPGVGRVTLDFCGGRMDSSKTLPDNALTLLHKEFGLSTTEAVTCEPITTQAWDVNSSFENQQLYGAIVKLPANIHIDENNIGATYELTDDGIGSLLTQLQCLQCRALLLECLHTDKLA